MNQNSEIQNSKFQNNQPQSMIRLVDVNKRFALKGKTIDAVKNVSLDIEKGSIFGIIGFSGAGKSTLVRCINLLERPEEGRVLIHDQDITAYKGKALRRQRKRIGMIFQHFNLFASRTVADNVAYPLKYTGMKKIEINQKVKELLKLVDLSDKADAYPSELSGGQKQRVAIARALASDPEILLSDEATSALDPQTTKSILKLLKQVNEQLGITIVMITHEMQVIKEICQKVVVMENGLVVEQGEVFDVFANPKAQITRNFVESTSNLSKIYELLEENKQVLPLKQRDQIIRFSYPTRNVQEALVSTVSRNYNLNLNIIFANIELIDKHPIGGLVAIVSGNEENIQAAIAYLKDKEVGVELLYTQKEAI